MTNGTSTEFSLFSDLIRAKRFFNISPLSACNFAFPITNFDSNYLSIRRFDYHTLQLLESSIASNDVKSLSNSRSILKSVLRSESTSAIHLFKHASIEKQLSVLEFFVRAFSLAGDAESCLVLRYEALVLREMKSVNCPWAVVSPQEWLIFAEQSFDNGFFSNAVKGCDYALSSLKKKYSEKIGKVEMVVEDEEFTRKVKKLRDAAISSASSGSVQAQAAEYIKKKAQINNSKKRSLPDVYAEMQPVASALFQNAIKKRHVRLLHQHQTLLNNS